MLSIFDGLRDIRFVTVLFRLLLAVLCGAGIGLERSYKNRPAGFRTHILICVAGTVASMTGLYLYLNAHLPTDISRLGAQVVSGLGFIGAGTIVVTSKQSIRGLTTAAGLWASGIIGLALGAGFYEGAITASALVVVTEVCFAKAGKRFKQASDFRMALHYGQRLALDRALRLCKDAELAITDLQIMSAEEDGDKVYTAVVSLRRIGEENDDALLASIRADSEIFRAEILEDKPL
ncbi:MAG: MgtC/SapB family protein [Oscillibacter sp.]|nr:MgtC/SapB family protein [Oscillibacter sp.]